FVFFFQAEDGIRYRNVTGVQTCALPILNEVNKIVLSFPIVQNIHHVHVWRYSDDFIMMDAHINVAPGLRADELEQLYQDIGQELQKELGINHITLQAECERGRKDKMIVPGHGINED